MNSHHLLLKEQRKREAVNAHRKREAEENRKSNEKIEIIDDFMNDRSANKGAH